MDSALISPHENTEALNDSFYDHLPSYFAR